MTRTTRPPSSPRPLAAIAAAFCMLVVGLLPCLAFSAAADGPLRPPLLPVGKTIDTPSPEPRVHPPLLPAGESVADAWALLGGLAHGGSVSVLAYSPDARLIATGGVDGTVCIWDAASGTLIRALQTERGSVNGLAYNLDGRRLAILSSSRRIEVWEPARGTLPASIADNRESERETSGSAAAQFVSFAFSADGQLLAGGMSVGAVRLWDAASGALLRSLAGDGEWVSAVAFSPDGSLLVSALDHTVQFWDVTSGAPLRTLAEDAGQAFAVAFSPDGLTLATAAHDGTLRLWNAANGALLMTREVRGWVASLAFSPDGQTLATGSQDGTVQLWDRASGASGRTLKTQRQRVTAVAFSPDGRTMASAADRMHIWDLASGALVRTLGQPDPRSETIAFSPDGRTLASRSSDRTLWFWELTGDGPIRPRALSGSWSDSVRGALVRTLKAADSVVAISPDGQTLARGGSDNAIRLVDAASGKPRWTMEGHRGSIASLAFSPDGRTLASGSFDNTVRLWDVAGGTPLRTLEGSRGVVGALAYSPDGLTLAGGGDPLQLWDAASGELRRAWDLTGWAAESLAFSPDGRALGVASRQVVVVDLVGDTPARTLERSGTGVTSLAFSPDGRTLAGGSDRFAPDAGPVRLWDLASGRLTGLLFAAGEFWIACRVADTGDRCWRYDDGTFVLVREEQARLRPLALPPRQSPPRLEVRVEATAQRPLLVPAGQPVPVEVRVRNTGAEPIFWLHLVPKAAAQGPFLFLPPPRLVKLDPGAGQTLTGRVSFAGAVDPPAPAAATLDLVLEMHQGEPIPIRVPVQGVAPEPRVVADPVPVAPDAPQDL